MGRTTCQARKCCRSTGENLGTPGEARVVQDAAGDEVDTTVAAAAGADAQIDGLPRAAAGSQSYEAIRRSRIRGLIEYFLNSPAHNLLPGPPSQ